MVWDRRPSCKNSLSKASNLRAERRPTASKAPCMQNGAWSSQSRSYPACTSSYTGTLMVLCCSQPPCPQKEQTLWLFLPTPKDPGKASYPVFMFARLPTAACSLPTSGPDPPLHQGNCLPMCRAMTMRMKSPCAWSLAEHHKT